MKARTALAAAGALAATTVLLLSGCSGSGSTSPSSAGSVTLAAYGGSGEDAERSAWFDPFQQKTGIDVITDSPVTWSRVQEMVDAGNVTWDIAQGGITQGVTNNPRLENIDCTIVDCAAFDGTAFPAFPQAVPIAVYSNVVTYNTNAFATTPPSGFSDFFNPAFKGTRMLPSVGTSGWAGILEAALLYDGVPRAQLYPLDVPRALRVIDGIKDQLIVTTDDSQCVNQIASGEASMGVCYNGRVSLGVDQGLPLAIAWGQQIQAAEYLYIPKGAPNLANAQALIAHVVANEGAIAEYIAYGSVNPKSPSVESKWTPFVPTANELAGDQAPIVFDQEWWVANTESTIETITEWLQS